MLALCFQFIRSLSSQLNALFCYRPMNCQFQTNQFDQSTPMKVTRINSGLDISSRFVWSNISFWIRAHVEYIYIYFHYSENIEITVLMRTKCWLNNKMDSHRFCFQNGYKSILSVVLHKFSMEKLRFETKTKIH